MEHKANTFEKALNIRLDKTTNSGQEVMKNCNLKCIWCHDDLFIRKKTARAADNDQMVKWCDQLIRCSGKSARIRIAGNGEPCITGTELIDLIEKLKSHDQVKYVCLTTNGTLLNDMVKDLRRVGIDSVTVSLNTLDKQRYLEITGKNYLIRVLNGLDKAVSEGISLKVNAIYTKYCEDEIDLFLDLSRDYNITVKFFELIDPSGIFMDKHLPISNLKTLIRNQAEQTIAYDFPYSGAKYTVRGELIDIKDTFAINDCPITDCPNRELCVEGCRRYVRLGIDGLLQPCGVRKDNVVDLNNNPDQAKIIESLRSGGKY